MLIGNINNYNVCTLVASINYIETENNLLNTLGLLDMV